MGSKNSKSLGNQQQTTNTSSSSSSSSVDSVGGSSVSPVPVAPPLDARTQAFIQRFIAATTNEKGTQLNNQLRDIVHDLIRTINEEVALPAAAANSSSSPSSKSPLNIFVNHESITLLHCLFALPTDILCLFADDDVARRWLLHSIRRADRRRLFFVQYDRGVYHKSMAFQLLFQLHRPNERGDFIWSIYREMIQLAFTSSSSFSALSSLHYPYQHPIIATGPSNIRGTLAMDFSAIFTYLNQIHLPESLVNMNKMTRECTREQAKLILELLYKPAAESESDPSDPSDPSSDSDIKMLHMMIMKNPFRFDAVVPRPPPTRRQKDYGDATDFFSLFFSRCTIDDVKIWLSLTRDTHDCLWPSRASHILLHQPIVRVIPVLYEVSYTESIFSNQIKDENRTTTEIIKLLEVERVRWEVEVIPQMRNELSVWLIPELARFTLEFLIPNPKATNFRLEKIEDSEEA